MKTTEVTRTIRVTIKINVELAEDEQFYLASRGVIAEPTADDLARRSMIHVERVTATVEHRVGMRGEALVSYRVHGQGSLGRGVGRQIEVKGLPEHVRDHLHAALLNEGVENG